MCVLVPGWQSAGKETWLPAKERWEQNVKILYTHLALALLHAPQHKTEQLRTRVGLLLNGAGGQICNQLANFSPQTFVKALKWDEWVSCGRLGKKNNLDSFIRSQDKGLQKRHGDGVIACHSCTCTVCTSSSPLGPRCRTNMQAIHCTETQARLDIELSWNCVCWYLIHPFLRRHGLPARWHSGECTYTLNTLTCKQWWTLSLSVKRC